MSGPTFEDDDPNDAGLVAKGLAGDNAAPLSITEISQLLKRTVEDRFGYVKLRGELSGVKRAASGHLYCCLKDDKAVIDGVMWRTGVQRLGFVPEDGIEVVATGKLTTYPGRSKYQIVIERMEIAGEGALLALLEKTRRRLEAEGLFAAERKRPLPFLPLVIGVVTSPTGAVIRDILHRLADRFPSRVLVWPVLVQGQGSAEQVAAALRGFAELTHGGAIPRPDLLIVARGGGSIEDLWGFNEEVVVRAIAGSPIPVISAVGHETDTTLADHAADRRAPTPTAAAEIAVPVLRELSAAIDEFGLRMRKCTHRPLTLGRERLEGRLLRMPRPETLVAQAAQKLDDAAERLRRGLADRAVRARTVLQDDRHRLSAPLLQSNMKAAKQRFDTTRFSADLVLRRIAERRERLDALERVRRQLDPKAPLARGYALVSAAGQPVIATRDSAAKQTLLTLEFADGTLDVVPGGAPKKRPAAPKPAGEQPKLL
ncbi:exodeoxyribonuclease VII large subunit [Altererythrobacter soli]|uniref:Exodeoxyribonuclease 7 large subunit n=1 Tax=Croceibacterium soli TaxID=1739690 RepID=A0A6I4URP1_9SPHN|nr:exodeoxyribonuclease VII large subunit [Croceibacterium soli]MXP40243.1 exodeoxyribonuclease VII large subunit [Croceibacterium soli]